MGDCWEEQRLRWQKRNLSCTSFPENETHTLRTPPNYSVQVPRVQRRRICTQSAFWHSSRALWRTRPFQIPFSLFLVEDVVRHRVIDSVAINFDFLIQDQFLATDAQLVCPGKAQDQGLDVQTVAPKCE